jgi:Mg/Co/Ni transporter MgtE
MGFSDVYDYAAGIADWIAMGLPTVHQDKRQRVEQAARKDAPTCTVQDRVGQVRIKLPEGWNVCVVLNSERIVLGLAELSNESEPEKSIEEIMRPAPLTVRPGQIVEDVCERLKAKKVAVALVTTSLGQFIGVLRLDELCK